MIYKDAEYQCEMLQGHDLSLLLREELHIVWAS